MDDPPISKQDAALVGTKELLHSPSVINAPAHVNKPVPAPSIYVDERGEIHNIRVGGKRMNLLYTRRGVMRSGDIHANIQHDFVFLGKVQVWRLTKDGETEKKIYGPYEYLSIPPYVPHVFHFLEDTVMAEWWEPEPFFAWFYMPYRRVVENSFSCQQPGDLQELVQQFSQEGKNQQRVFWYGMVAGAASLGFGLGIVVCTLKRRYKF